MEAASQPACHRRRKKMPSSSRSAHSIIKLSAVHRLTCIFVASIVCLCVTLGNAQVISVGDDTSTPVEGAGHDYIKALAETVNPANGSLSLRIQASPAKGRGITLPYSFNYESNGVNHVVPQGVYVSALSDQTYVSQGGWGYSLPSITASRWSSSVNTNNSTVTCTFSSGYTFQDPSGGRHNLGLAAASWASNGQYICSNPRIGGGDQQYGASLVTTANAGNTILRFR